MSQTALKTEEEFLADGHTPMMAQYMSIKERHPDCMLFYRMGDFYELFFDDAVKASKILDITLTKRGKNESGGIPMAGVPYHSYEPYLARLIRAGCKVGICEQTETPQEAKKRGGTKTLVNRDVVRIVTQGTLTEETLLDARENNYLCAVAMIGGQLGISWLELSTGEFQVQATEIKHLGTTLERINASEILIPQNFTEIPELYSHLALIQDKITTQSPSLFDSQNAQKRLEKLFAVGTLEAFGGFSRAETAAAGALLDYVDRTQKGAMPHVARPRQITPGAIMEIDAATRRNLELIRTLSGEKKGSLLSCIDMTVTGTGARLLQAKLGSPLNDIDTILHRQAEVQCFTEDNNFRQDIREQLNEAPDMERSLARLTANRGGPPDLGALRHGLKLSEILRVTLSANRLTQTPLAQIIQNLEQTPDVQALSDHLKNALKDELPALLRDGGYIKEGYHNKLDNLRILRSESRKLIAELQKKYQQKTGVDTLKISFNNVLGYFVEVTARHGDKLMVDRKGTSDSDNAPSNDNPFIHRQTMKNSVRFTTPELAELERDISQAAERSTAIEEEIYGQLLIEVSKVSENIGKAARALAALDVAAGLAELAMQLNYTRPAIDNSNAFDIKAGRHPVVEAAIKQDSGTSFVANDCQLENKQKLWLLTGPNMAGKSTFLRQNALITILAQIGSYVPADKAHIGLVDRLFSRVGASDDLASGRSTFMVEMVETATILNQATERSLVILDEIGRGTATFDGLSIAWACVEQLHENNKCRALFATHYHEITSLQSKLENMACHSLQVKEWKNDIIFLHRVKPGSADHSYGIHVAKLAGLPETVIKRAEQVLQMLQESEQSGTLSKLADDLPLFSTIEKEQSNSNISSALQLKLDEINPDELSPRQALQLLYELKSIE